MRKRIFALLLALVMALGLTVTAAADEPVSVNYIDPTKPADQQIQTCETYTTVTSKTTTWNTGWYVVSGEETINGLSVTGDVKLILCDGAKLGVTATSDYDSGIKIEGTLTIYGQSGQTGVLTSAATDKSYHGIYVTTNSNLTVNGGNVTGTGNAAIPGSYGIEFGSGALLTVNGGTVTAIGSYSGTHSGTMTINGGTLIAEHTGATGYAVASNLVPPTTTYWWRTAVDGDFTASSTSAYNKESTASYVEITTIEPVAAPPADEPEPDEEPAAPGHEPIRRQHTTTTVEETTPDTDTKADEAKTDTVTSAKTFDTGVAVYGAMAVASLLGMGYVGKKRV